MPTIGLLKCDIAGRAVEVASPKAKIPPSEATIQ